MHYLALLTVPSRSLSAAEWHTEGRRYNTHERHCFTPSLVRTKVLTPLKASQCMVCLCYALITRSTCNISSNLNLKAHM